MIAMEALKEVMKIREIRPAVLCDRLGIKSNVLSERFKQKNVSVTKLNEMLRLMDYKIVFPVTAGCRKVGSRSNEMDRT